MRSFEAPSGAAVDKPTAFAKQHKKQPVAASEEDDAVKRTITLLIVVLLCVVIIAAIWIQSGTTKTASKRRTIVISVQGLTSAAASAASAAGLTPALDVLVAQGGIASATATSSPFVVTDPSITLYGSLASILSGVADSKIPISFRATTRATPGSSGTGVVLGGPQVSSPFASFLQAGLSGNKWVSVLGSTPFSLSDGVNACGVVDLECTSQTQQFTLCDIAGSGPPGTVALAKGQLSTAAAMSAAGTAFGPVITPLCNSNVRYWLPTNDTDADLAVAIIDSLAKSEIVFADVDLVLNAMRSTPSVFPNATSPSAQADPLSGRGGLAPASDDLALQAAIFVLDSVIGRVMMTIADRAAERSEQWLVLITGTAPFAADGVTPLGVSQSGAPPPVYFGMTGYWNGKPMMFAMPTGASTAVPQAVTAATTVLNALPQTLADIAPTVVAWMGITAATPMDGQVLLS